MASSWPNLGNNLTEGIRRVKFKYEHDNKKCETCGSKYKNWECFLEYKNLRHNSVKDKCLCCNNNYRTKFDKNLKKWFFNTYNFSNHDISKFILLTRKVVYSYEYMNDWKTLNEILLPEKGDFYSISAEIMCTQKEFVKIFK